MAKLDLLYEQRRGHPQDEGAENLATPILNHSGAKFQTEVSLIEPTFQSALSLPHFSLGFPALDALLRPYSEGHMVALSGTCSSAVAELAVFRTQLPHEMGGLDSGVLFIDGGNRSDPYLFSAFAKQWRFRPRATMRRVATCRVFTMYQLTALISGYLDHVVDDYAAKLVVISDLLATFNEPELDDREARRLLDAIEEGVRRLQKKAMVMITLASPNEYDDTVAAWADTVVSLTPHGRRIYAELLRHPEKPRSASTFRLNEFLANNREG